MLTMIEPEGLSTYFNSFCELWMQKPTHLILSANELETIEKFYKPMCKPYLDMPHPAGKKTLVNLISKHTFIFGCMVVIGSRADGANPFVRVESTKGD